MYVKELKKIKRKVPFKVSIHHRSHMSKLPAVHHHHHQENHTKYYMNQSKELSPIHNLAIKAEFLKLSWPRKEKQRLCVTGNSERSVRMSSLNPTHQGMRESGEHCTKTRTQTQE